MNATAAVAPEVPIEWNHLSIAEFDALLADLREIDQMLQPSEEDDDRTTLGEAAENEGAPLRHAIVLPHPPVVAPALEEGEAFSDESELGISTIADDLSMGEIEDLEDFDANSVVLWAVAEVGPAAADLSEFVPAAGWAPPGE